MGWRDNMGVKTENEQLETYEQKEQKGSSSAGPFAPFDAIALEGQKVKSMSEEEFNFEERAAIMEFDGGLDRENAERQAKRSICVQSSIVKKWE